MPKSFPASVFNCLFPEIDPPAPPKNFTLRVPRMDRGEEVAFDSPTEPAEGQSFTIVYRDASGAESTRRISVWGVRRDRGVMTLVARCHERKATRMFRVDRILTIADLHGEVHHSPPAFLAHLFGVELSGFHVAPLVERKAALRRFLREAGLPVLVALARADHDYCLDERGELLDYAVHSLVTRGIEVSDDDFTWLRQYTASLRPTHAAIDNGLIPLARQSPEAIAEFIAIARRVMDADGFRHPAELEAFENLCTILQS
jgi:hypothetical protein